MRRLLQWPNHEIAGDLPSNLVWVVVKEAYHPQAHPTALCQEPRQVTPDLTRTDQEYVLLTDALRFASLENHACNQTQDEYTRSIQQTEAQEEQAR
jgi:hypothetical protein